MSAARLSAIVPISGRHGDIATVFRRYRSGLAQTGMAFEFIYVLDGPYPLAFEALRRLQSEGEPLRIVQLARWFGEATAISAGCTHASGEFILTLPAYEQIEPDEIPRLVAGLDTADMVVARRWPRIDGTLNRLQARLFNGTVNLLTGTVFHDLGCSVRVMKRELVEEIALYGDQHRFLPLLAQRNGFRVVELDTAQSRSDSHRRLYGPGVYLRRALDVLSIFFLVKFTKKPLRFFGLLGTAIAAVGGLLLTYLVIVRLVGGTALADRPALLLSSLMVVLGIQMLALGLLGELIIHTHAGDIKEYTIEAIFDHDSEALAEVAAMAEPESGQGISPDADPQSSET